MSSADAPHGSGGGRGFGLESRIDDPEDPRELTFFPRGDEPVATTWITVDVDDAVDLREFR